MAKRKQPNQNNRTSRSSKRTNDQQQRKAAKGRRSSNAPVSSQNKKGKEGNAPKVEQPLAERQTIAEPSTSLGNIWSNQSWHIIFIMALSFALYANTLTHDYALDDSIVIIENSFTKQGFAGIKDILSYDTFMGFFGKEKNLVAGGRYRPLSLVTFAAEWALLGENPMISHLINILLYGLTGVILYLVMIQFFKNTSTQEVHQNAYFIALATTTLFIAHPIHTEAVANIKGRDEIMALLGSLTALYWTLKYIDTQKLLYIIGSTVVFFAALMSKENSITFLAIIPLALYFFRKTSLQKIILTTVPYVAMAGIFLFIRSSVLGEGAQIGQEANELMNNPFLGLNFQERYGTIFYTLGKYIQLLVYPHPLTHDYYPRHISIFTFSDLEVILSLLAYLGMGIFALIRLPKRDPVAFGIIFYIATLSIVSNLLFSVGTNMSERLIFMPSVGFCFILAILVQRWLLKVSTKNITLAVGVIGVVALLFSVKTILRNPVWKDNYTLFAADIKVSANSAKLNNAMGGVTIEAANKEENKAQKTELLNNAIGYLTKAVEVHPDYANAYLLTGNAFFYQGNYDKAAEYYRYIIQRFDNPNGKENLSKTGQRFVDQQKFAKAIPILEEVKNYFPNDTEIYGNLGAAYGQTQQHQKAIENFQKVLEIEPNNAKAHLFIGYGYMSLASTNPSLASKGTEYIQKAYQLDPNLQPK